VTTSVQQLRGYLTTMLAALLAEAETPGLNPQAGMYEAAAAALRRMGVAEGGSTAEVDAAQALGEYYALRYLRNVFAARFDLDATGVKTRSPIYQHVSEMMAEAAQTCGAWGYAVGADASAAWVTLNLDYIEPEPTE